MAQCVLERGQGQGLSAAATIFALSSGPPPCGVAVVRITGSRAFAALAALSVNPPPLRQAAVRALRDPLTADLLDRAMVLRFAAPASATGDDVVELHLHGGRAVVAGVLDALAALDGLRLAKPGEFTRRAFDNGKLDLSRAEGLADLVDAETEAQRRAALAQAGGGLADAAERWRGQLIGVMAALEAELDFADDEADVTLRLPDTAARQLASLRDELAAAIADARRGLRLRDGLTVVVAGPTNVGKSSIVNRLAQSDIAIVSPFAGTTRDAVEARLDIGGVMVTLVDTAGLREAADPVEAEGIRRARARAADADLVLQVTIDQDPAAAGQAVRNMIDLNGDPPGLHGGVLHVSAATGAGFGALEAWLADWARNAVRPGDPVLVTRLRHRAALEAGLTEIERAATETETVLRAEALRLAARALARITGRVDADQLLDDIFGRFCIGK